MENKGNHHNQLSHGRGKASKGESFALFMSGSHLRFSSGAIVEEALSLQRSVLGSASPLVHHVTLNKSLFLSGL